MGHDAATCAGVAGEMIKAGEKPFDTPETPDAIGRAKEFCKARGITPKHAKIVNRDGRVWVETKVDTHIGSAANVEACRVCYHLKHKGKECNVCAKRQTS